MAEKPIPQSPYFDWSLDQWKVLVIVLLFVALLAGTAIGPGSPREVPLANGPAMSDAASAGNAVGSAPARSGVTDDTTEGGRVVTVPLVPDKSDSEGEPGALPLTLASLGPNTVISAAGIAALSGTGNSVGQIEVRDQLIQHTQLENAPVPTSEESLIGVAPVDARGIWTLPLDDVLAPGQHILSMREVDTQGNILSVSAPSVVLVLERGEEGPPSLATPLIRFPAPAATLRAGPTVFLGSGMPGMRVRLFLNGVETADGIVNSLEEWRMTPTDDVSPGIYVAHVESYNEEGNLVSESPPIAFSVVEPVEDVLVDP